MAGKAHVDDSVIERRLRPIYEWLDAGKNKKAVQEADKVLRKQASLPCARVLKGLALLRLGKRDECDALVAGVVKETPTDEATLQALTICFREMHQPEQICQVYETATKVEAGNEELLSHLFMSYVRISDYRNQQQTAMKLYKLKPKNPYYFWAVMSYVMQGVKGGDSKSRQVSLMLAEKMVKNFVKDGKIEAEAEVLTYLHILETQGKYAEALSVVEGELGSKIVHQPGNFLRLKRATYHTHLGQWKEAAAVYRDLIKDEHDNWQHYVGYIDAIMRVTGRSDGDCGGSNSIPGECPSNNTCSGNSSAKPVNIDSKDCNSKCVRDSNDCSGKLNSKDCSTSEKSDCGMSDSNDCSGECIMDSKDCTVGGDSLTSKNCTSASDSNCTTDPAGEKNGSCCVKPTSEECDGRTSGEKGDDPLSDAVTHLLSVRETAKSRQYPDRGPFLGVIHMTTTLLRLGDHATADSLCGDLMDLLLSYIMDYGDKMCCYADLAQYLPLVPKDRIVPFLRNLEAMIERREDGVPLDVKSMYRDLCWVQVSRALGQHEQYTAQQHTQLADSLLHRYHSTLPLTENMATTDIRPGDAYLLLSAHSYLRAAGVGAEGTTCLDPLVLLRVAAILERGVLASRANFQIKLLLIKVYNMMGACEASHGVYEKCDLKHIQLDTLAHTLALQALDSAHYTIASDIFSATLKFFMANYKDTSDPLISSYKYGSLTRIPEFVEFRERLSNSLHFATVTAEQMLLDLTSEVSSHSQLVESVSQLDIDPARDKTCWPDLRDNRDLTVMDTWDPHHRRLQSSDIETNVEGGVAMLKLRNLTLRMMAAACRMANPKANKEQAAANKENSECMNGEDSTPSDATLLSDLTTRLQNQYDQCQQYRASTLPQLPLQGPDVSRIYLYSSCNLVLVITRHSQLLQAVYQYSQGSAGGWSGEVIKSARKEMETAIQAGVTEAEQLTMATVLAHAARNSQTRGSQAIEGSNNLTNTNLPPQSESHPTSDIPNSITSIPNQSSESHPTSGVTNSLAADLSKLALSNSASSHPALPCPGLARLHHLAQTLGVAVGLMGCCHAILRPIKTAISKKNKKRKEPAVVPEAITQFGSYMTALSGELHRLEKTIASQESAVRAAQESHSADNYATLDLTSLLTGTEDSKLVGEKVELSYLKSLESLSSSIASKLKHVTSLKL